MLPSISEICTLDDLRNFVHLTLCKKENLLPDQFSLDEQQLIRGSTPCGMQFTLIGPRSVRLGAVWAADHNTVYFYDAQGVRYEKEKLTRRIEQADSEQCAA